MLSPIGARRWEAWGHHRHWESRGVSRAHRGLQLLRVLTARHDKLRFAGSGACVAKASTQSLGRNQARSHYELPGIVLIAVTAFCSGCFTLCSGTVEKVYKDTNIVSAPIILCFDLVFGAIYCPLAAVTGQLGKTSGNVTAAASDSA